MHATDLLPLITAALDYLAANCKLRAARRSGPAFHKSWAAVPFHA